MTTTKTDDRPWLSGFCNPTHDHASHDRCPRHMPRGSGPRAGTPCACPCHTPPEPDAANTTPDAAPPTVNDAETRLHTDLIDEALLNLEDAIRGLNVALLGMPSLDFDTAAEMLAREDTARAALAVIHESMTLHTWKARGDRYGDVVHPTLGTIGVRRGKNRKEWQHDALAGAVVDAHMDATGGELPDPDTVRTWITDAAGISYWKVTALKELGIEVEDYCATLPGKPGVSITRPTGPNPLLVSPPDA